MNTAFWQERLARCPAMRPWLTRAARYAAAAETLPATLTLGGVPEDKAVYQALREIFPDCREENGRLKTRLPPALRECALWRPLADLLGVQPALPKTVPSPDECLEQTVRRLKVLFPGDAAFIGRLRGSDPLRRFFSSSESASNDLVALVEALVSLRAAPAGLTLSELGAKCFNDSKALRNGPLRQQFENLLRLQSGDDDSDATALLNACGIIENPYTTHAVVFAPFSYLTLDGARLDWPLRLWQRGEAAILSWKTVRSLASIRLEEPCPFLITSENAAPFHRLVEARRPVLYTEGYPNAAVKTLLQRFAQAGSAGRHWGDTDLDGFRIAEQVSRCIPSTFFDPQQGLPHARLKRLTHEQHRRLAQFIDAHPDFRYLAELRRTLAHGWLEQEQTIDLLT